MTNSIKSFTCSLKRWVFNTSLYRFKTPTLYVQVAITYTATGDSPIEEFWLEASGVMLIRPTRCTCFGCFQAESIREQKEGLHLSMYEK
ncbi:hypothetical protein N7481_006996 [Penicillium waksmanii]|uniref:uncharacterized protein n=1 Tax=Penicillium waksmanii TaxID=69791 RepID=UPI0025472A5B|nr:uncharacterized protein N7481_006996 [Penicillium waksmanii]KAJ5979698.1 hypothetical protein N7481_006996 [Penicillium waksmanii]